MKPKFRLDDTEGGDVPIVSGAYLFTQACRKSTDRTHTEEDCNKYCYCVSDKGYCKCDTICRSDCTCDDHNSDACDCDNYVCTTYCFQDPAD